MAGKENPKNETFLCFDLGTTRVKSALLGSKGNVIYLDTEKSITYQEENKIFQKPEDFYNIVENQIKRIAKKHKEDFKNVKKVILSCQMAGVLSIDKNWEVIVPWFYSIDTRANKYLYQIEKGIARRIRAVSGGIPFTASRIKWLKEEFPRDYRKSHKFINLATYVAGRLSNINPDDAFIDYSVLAMNGLAITEKGVWNKEIIEDLVLDQKKLPLIIPPYRVVGSIPKASFHTKNDIKVLAGIGDQIAGFIGAGVLNKGDLIDVSGTYNILGYYVDHFVPDTKKEILSTIYTGVENIYYQLAAVAVGGHLHRWFIDKFSYDINHLKGLNKDTRDLYFIPHLGGRFSPSQPYYKGTFYGLGWNHDLDSIYKAMLECIGYEYGLVLETMKKLNREKNIGNGSIKVIGGGAKNDIWNRIKANILKLEYYAMSDFSYEILGGYLIARYGNDIRKGYDEVSNLTTAIIRKEILPEENLIIYYKQQRKCYKKVVDEIKKIYCYMENR